MTWPSPSELVDLLPVLHSDSEDDDARNAVLRLYLFLPVVTADGVHYRSSLEALQRDARGTGGRDADSGELLDADHTRSWLSAMGYLALVDQVSKALHVPLRRKGTTPFELLLVHSAGLAEDEAAAIYALRCAFVHNYGLRNDPRPRVTDEDRIRALLHMFNLSATGGPLVQIGDRSFLVDGAVADIETTVVDLRSLGNTVEALVRSLRDAHVAGADVSIRRDIRLADFRRACFFMHRDPIPLTP